MDRSIEVDTTPGLELSLSIGSDSEAYLEHQDDDELDEFDCAQTRQKMQQKRRKAAGA